MDTVAPPAPGRSRRNRGSEIVRNRLIEGGIEAFAAHGFEGASTRTIAEGADAHQSQIKYHFDTKSELWRRCLERLLAELDAAIAHHLADVDTGDLRAGFEAMVRGLVKFASERPELNRIMMHEATSPSDRLAWLVDTQAGDRRTELKLLWQQLGDAGLAAPIDDDVLYHTLVGAASLLYANEPEARLMGIDPTDPQLVERHAESLIAMFLLPDSPTED